MSNPRYRPDIDGLRGIAVISVVTFHGFPGVVGGGFTGVDIFFVISGFLISRIILTAFKENEFGFFEFYARRARRIFPALICVLAVTLLFGWIVLLPDEFEQLGTHIVAGAGFVSNLNLWHEAGYFDNTSTSKPLLHLWSLGIEEQFYLVWPALLLVLTRLRANLLLAITIIAAISFSYNVFEAQWDPVGDFFSPLTRFWELMLGASLAAANAHQTWHNWQKLRLFSDLRSIGGIVAIVAGLIIVNENDRFPGVWALLPTSGAVLLLSCDQTALINRYMLSFRPLVRIGLISYPLYLWHWPLLSFANIVGYSTVTVRAGLVLLAVLLSMATYRFIEVPIRFAAVKTARTVGVFFGIAMIGLLGYASGYISPRISQTFDAFKIQQLWSTLGMDYEKVKLSKDAASEIVIYSKNSELRERTAFIGDSHAMQYSARVRKIIEDNPRGANSTIFSVGWGCPPIPQVREEVAHQHCAGSIERTLEYVRADPNINTVVFCADWLSYFGSVGMPQSKFYFENVDGTRSYLGPGSPGSAKALEKLRTILHDFSLAGRRVYLVLSIPTGAEFDPRNLIANRFASGTALLKKEDRGGSAFVGENVWIKSELSKMGNDIGIRVIDPTLFLCNSDGCLTKDENGPIYANAGHLRSGFIRVNATWIDETVRPHL